MTAEEAGREEELSEEELRKEYEKYCEPIPEEVNGKKIKPIDFETFKEYKKKGVFEEMEKGLSMFNEALED